MTDRPTLLAIAFRPFFLLAAAWALTAMALWLWSLMGGSTLPAVTPAWHAHELLFGVVAAAAAGFALTAVATWTGTAPMAGLPLAGLLLLWITGRLLMLLAFVPDWLVAAVNVGFPLALALALGRRVLAAGSRRNYPLVLILLVYAAAQLAWHLADGSTQIAQDAGLLAVAAMISLIGGRITPAFTRNWLRGQKRPETVRDTLPAEVVNVAALLLAALAMLAGQPLAASALAGVAALAAFWRWLGWNGARTLAEPLLWILHLAWLWLVAALLLKALAGTVLPIPATIWWHALGTGAIGTVLLGVMTRVALGHTGRVLRLPRGGVLIYGLVSVGALARVTAAFLPGTYWMPLLTVAATSWMLAWLGYLLLFGPILLSRRPDGRPG